MNDYAVPRDISIKPPHTHTNPLQASLLWAIPGESRTFKRVPVSAEASSSAGQMVAFFQLFSQGPISLLASNH